MASAKWHMARFVAVVQTLLLKGRIWKNKTACLEIQGSSGKISLRLRTLKQECQYLRWIIEGPGREPWCQPSEWYSRVEWSRVCQTRFSNTHMDVDFPAVIYQPCPALDKDSLKLKAKAVYCMTIRMEKVKDWLNRLVKIRTRWARFSFPYQTR